MTSYSAEVPVTPGPSSSSGAPRRHQATVITEAEPSYDEQLRSRRKRYLIMMSMRVPCLILATLLYHTPWLAILVIAISIPLPWMAVLIANDRPPRRPDEPRRFDGVGRRTPLFPTAERPALERYGRPAPQPGSPPTDADGPE